MPRILYVPMYSSPDRVATDSTYNWAKIFFSTVVQNDPQAFVYFPVPEGFDNEYKEIDHPRISLFPVEMYGQWSQYHESAWLQEVYLKKFADAIGPYHPDIVVCDKASVLPMLKLGIDMWFKDLQMPKVYMTKTHFIFDSDEIPALSPDFEMVQSLGYAMADVVSWMSEQDYDRGVSIAERYLSPALLLRIQKSKHIGGWLGNFLLTESLQHDPASKPKSPIKLSWAYGANADYHVRQVMDVYDTVFKTNPNVRVLMTSSGGTGRAFKPILEKMSYIERYQGLPQLEFFKKLREAHIFAYWPTRPFTSPSTVMEQQMMGLAGVFCADERRPATLYPGYPYLASNKNEMMQLVRFLADHYFDPEVQEVIQKQREWNLKLYDPTADSMRVYDRLRALLNEQLEAKKGKKKEIVDMLSELTVGLPEVTLDQLITLIKKQSRSQLNLRAIKDLPHIGTCIGQLRTFMRYAGFNDNCTSPDVTFVRDSGATGG